MSTVQIILTVVFYIWLFVVVGLLAYHAKRSGTYVRGLQHTLSEIAKQSADAATTSANAVERLVTLMEQEKKDAGPQ